VTDRAADLIETFVIRARRDRYLKLLGSARGRDKLRERLAHFADLDPRYATRVQGAHSASAIAAILHAKGAPSSCYVLSESSRIDNAEVALVEALEKIVGYGVGTFVSCIPSRLAYFEGEEPGERYILERSARAT
jgi:hypothetical protein